MAQNLMPIFRSKWRRSEPNSWKCMGCDIKCLAVFHFMTSRNGKRLIIYRGYTYSHTKKCVHTNHWRCSSHKSRGCKGRLILNSENTIISSTHEHIHRPSEFIFNDGQWYKI